MAHEFVVGEVVQVLAAAWLPVKEHVIGRGTVERITVSSAGESLYWLSGHACARTARCLRHSDAGYDVPATAGRTGEV